MSLEDRDWYKQDYKRRSNISNAPKSDASRRSTSTFSKSLKTSATRHSKLYWSLILFMIAAAIVSELI
jgi:hypothetical protein